MTDLPPIGARVVYRGALRIAAGAVCRVVRHFPRYPDPDNPHVLAPKSEWTVALELETLPRDWPFPHRRLTATAGDLEPAAEARREPRTFRRARRS